MERHNQHYWFLALFGILVFVACQPKSDKKKKPSFKEGPQQALNYDFDVSYECTSCGYEIGDVSYEALPEVFVQTTSDVILDAAKFVPEAQVMSAADHARLEKTSKPRLKFKDGKRYIRDLASSLQLEREEICLELSGLDCVDAVHFSVLGGISPYRGLLYEPLEHVSITSPIALDRVALSACVRRIEADLKKPSQALFFQNITWTEETQTALVVRLYDRILRRNPQEQEVDKVREFYQELVAEHGDSQETQKHWVTLSCFMVASSVEAIFY